MVKKKQESNVCARCGIYAEVRIRHKKANINIASCRYHAEELKKSIPKFVTGEFLFEDVKRVEE